MSKQSAAWIWGILLVAGQAASLVLVEAGPRVSYQHYRWPASPAGWAALVVLVVQAIVVITAGRAALGRAGTWVRAQVPFAIRLMVVAAFVFSSATASKSVQATLLELLVATLVQSVALGNVILLATAVTRGSAASWVLGTGSSAAPSPWRDPLALTAAASVFVVASLLALFVYQNHPHVPDEVAYLLQARYFAEGALWMPAPPAPLAFNLDLMHYEAARWYTPTPPGWPGALAVGVALGVPWLVNPVLGAANVLLTHRVFSSMYDRGVARLATLLLATSPWFVFMSMNFMTHQVVLCCGLLAAVAVARVRDERARGRVKPATYPAIFGGGLSIGAASLVRPLEGLAIALLLGFWSLPPRWWEKLTSIPSFVASAVLTAGAVAGGLVVRPYNTLMTGKASYFPIMAYIDKYYTKGSNDLGFGANRGLGWSGLDPFPGHGAKDVVVNAALNVASINTEWLGWATGSLLVLLVAFALRRMERPDWWHVAVIATIIGIHSFYWFSGGPDFGARYWFLVIVSCAALTARGLVSLDRALTARPGVPRVTTAGLVLVLAAWLTFVPWRAADKYYHYRGMRPDVRTLAKTREFGRSLVFVRGKRHPDYASAAAYNPLDLTADVPLYAWDASPEARAEALRVYADRPVFFLDGPTRSGEGFRVVAGPLTTAEAQAFPAQ